jgi:hypothetical protein
LYADNIIGGDRFLTVKRSMFILWTNNLWELNEIDKQSNDRIRHQAGREVKASLVLVCVDVRNELADLPEEVKNSVGFLVVPPTTTNCRHQLPDTRKS